MAESSLADEVGLRFWGVRGSFPSAALEHQELGGHTACVSLDYQQEWLIVDAGSGLRDFADHYAQLDRPGRLTLLISHCHWDHILGFPYLTQRLGTKLDIQVVSLKRNGVRVEDSLKWQQQKGRSCLDWEDVLGKVSFVEMDEEEHAEFGVFRVATRQLNHPGVSSGFRVEVAGRSLAYVSDLAPVREALLADRNGSDLPEVAFRERLWDNEHALTCAADAVIYDTFFAEQDWPARVHWGHSAASHAIANCRQSKAKHLFLFHHSGEYTDVDQQQSLEGLKLGCQDLHLQLAQQGRDYRLGS